MTQTIPLPPTASCPQQDLALTAGEMAVVASTRNKALADPVLREFVSEQMVVQALMARKFEEHRALELLTNSAAWRKKNGIWLYQPITPNIVRELKTKKVIIPPQSRDKEGSQVVYYRPGLAIKHPVSPDEFCLSVFYLLQRCVQDPLTQRKGFLFICDLRGTKMSQVDRKLVKSILDMLSNKFPARLKKVLLLEPPTFFSFAFHIIRPIIPSKYLDKLAMAKMPDLLHYVDCLNLLTDYGGTLTFDPSSYIDCLYAEEQVNTIPTLNNPIPQANADFVKNLSPMYAGTMQGAATF